MEHLKGHICIIAADSRDRVHRPRSLEISHLRHHSSLTRLRLVKWTITLILRRLGQYRWYPDEFGAFTSLRWCSEGCWTASNDVFCLVRKNYGITRLPAASTIHLQYPDIVHLAKEMVGSAFNISSPLGAFARLPLGLRAWDLLVWYGTASYHPGWANGRACTDNPSFLTPRGL